MAGTVTEGNDTDGSDEAGVVMAETVTGGKVTGGVLIDGVLMAGTVTGGKVTGGSDEPSVLTDGRIWDSDCPLDDAGERVPETGRLADGNDTEESAAVFGVGAVGIRPFAVLRFVEEGAELTTVPTAAPTAEPREDGDGAGWFALVEVSAEGSAVADAVAEVIADSGVGDAVSGSVVAAPAGTRIAGMEARVGLFVTEEVVVTAGTPEDTDAAGSEVAVAELGETGSTLAPTLDNPEGLTSGFEDAFVLGQFETAADAEVTAPAASNGAAVDRFVARSNNVLTELSPLVTGTEVAVNELDGSAGLAEETVEVFAGEMGSAAGIGVPEVVTAEADPEADEIDAGDDLVTSVVVVDGVPVTGCEGLTVPNDVVVLGTEATGTGVDSDATSTKEVTAGGIDVRDHAGGHDGGESARQGRPGCHTRLPSCGRRGGRHRSRRGHGDGGRSSCH